MWCPPARDLVGEAVLAGRSGVGCYESGVPCPPSLRCPDDLALRRAAVHTAAARGGRGAGVEPVRPGDRRRVRQGRARRWPAGVEEVVSPRATGGLWVGQRSGGTPRHSLGVPATSPQGHPEGGHRIRLHPARPAASNFPTPAGVAGAEEMLRLLASAGPDDTALCLISGGGSALLPCPADGVSLESKLAVTKLLTGCGATIHEMNCVRKHLSRVKGGRLAEAFRGRQLVSPHHLGRDRRPARRDRLRPHRPGPDHLRRRESDPRTVRPVGTCPADVTAHIQKGCDGIIPDTPKTLPANVRNVRHRQQRRRPRRRSPHRRATAVSRPRPRAVRGRGNAARRGGRSPASSATSASGANRCPAGVHPHRRGDDGDARRESGEGRAEPGVRAGDAGPAWARTACGAWPC